MKTITLQKFLFEQEYSRGELLKFPVTSCNHKKVKIYRNHSFELVANTMKAYLEYADLNIEFQYSDYDDSLSFLDFDNSVDAVIIWVDVTRYKINNPEQFIANRLKELRTHYTKPIILATLGMEKQNTESDIVMINCDSLIDKLGTDKFDMRMEPFTGTRLSNKACLLLSKELGLKYLPAVLKPALKAIFVDLDNTLYQGVLGEDGISGVVLTPAHKILQEKLKKLAEQFFVCIISKNEQQDVEKLFSERDDFPLKASDFTKIYASWKPKSVMISETLKFLNIGADAALFIDDNIGEITEVASAINGISVILAGADASVTSGVLDCYPGLLKLITTKDDTLRKKDVQANLERQKMQETLSHEDFLRQLKMEIKVLCDDVNGKERIAQLAGKTNQFIFTYRRYSLTDVENLMNDNNSVIVSLHLKDSLSDSGMIGALVLKKQDEKTAVLDECFISCRALGRGIDDLIVLEAINIGMKHLKVKNLQVLFTKGERNGPAETFVNKFLTDYLKPQTFIAPKQTDLVTFKYGEN